MEPKSPKTWWGGVKGDGSCSRTMGEVSDICYNFLYFKCMGIKIVFCAKLTKFKDVNHTIMIDVTLATAFAKDLEP